MTNPVELNDDILDQANGGLIGLLKVGEPEAQGLTKAGVGTLTLAGSTSPATARGGLSAGKVSMSDISF